MEDFGDYFNHFQRVFDDDFGFSRKFKKTADKILLANLVEMRDHEQRETEEDIIADTNGADRTIQLSPKPIGVRVRREKYLHFADFTIDTKEWTKTKHPHFYLYAYGNPATKQFLFYMLWYYKEFKKLVTDGKIKPSMEKNKTHSTVKFLAFPLKEIFDKCSVLDFGGTPEAIRKILGDTNGGTQCKL